MAVYIKKALFVSQISSKTLNVAHTQMVGIHISKQEKYSLSFKNKEMNKNMAKRNLFRGSGDGSVVKTQN